jgi:uncharacterized protein
MFSSAVVKLTSICNMNCSYCYMFNAADRTFERVPKLMSVETATRLVARIVEHMTDTGLSTFTIALHGGEPTLWPQDSFEALLDEIDRARQRGFLIECSLQTNAYQPLKPALASLFRAHGITLGISIDGPRRFNDAMRVTHGGQGTHDRVIANVESLIERGYRDILGGFLCVANPEIPPEDFVRWANRLPLRNIDLLWPINFNWTRPPWEEAGELSYRVNPTYGVWFSRVFTEWWRLDDPTLYIRCFRQLIDLHIGSARHTDAYVNDRLDMFVVNTDGRIEYPDYVRAAGDGAAATRYTLQQHSLADAASDDLFTRLYNLSAQLPSECADCAHRASCGGGFLPGRAGSDGPLQRKSVLCHDQALLFSTIRFALQAAGLES